MVISVATAFHFLLMAPSLLLGLNATMTTATIRVTFASIRGMAVPGINAVAISMEKTMVITLATVFLFLLTALSSPSVLT